VEPSRLLRRCSETRAHLRLGNVTWLCLSLHVYFTSCHDRQHMSKYVKASVGNADLHCAARSGCRLYTYHCESRQTQLSNQIDLRTAPDLDWNVASTAVLHPRLQSRWIPVVRGLDVHGKGRIEKGKMKG